MMSASPDSASNRRMMDQHHAKQSAAFVEQCGKAGELRLAKFAGRQERRSRHRRRKSDQRNASAPALERECADGCAIIAAHIVAPISGRRLHNFRHIDVVITGNNGDVVCRAQAFKPAARACVFARERQIDQITGDRNVVDGLAFEIVRDGVECLAAVNIFAAAMPIDEAEPALAGKLAEPRPDRQMQVG